MSVGIFSRKKMWRKCNRKDMSNNKFSFFELFDFFKFCRELIYDEDYIPTLSESIDNDRNEKKVNIINFDKILCDSLDESDNTTNEEDSSDTESIEEELIEHSEKEYNIFRDSPTSITKVPNIKQIKFDSIVRTILIPTADEYKKYNLSSVLWYSLTDIERFKKDLAREIHIKILFSK